MVMKSLTGSQKAIEILNRLGHCVSYNLVEEIETELTYAVNEKDNISASGMNMDANACTGLAFNNYDRSAETIKLDDTIDNNPLTTDFNITSTSSNGKTVVYICLFLSELFTILMEI